MTQLAVYDSGSTTTLLASTYGRGIWSIGLASVAVQGTLTPSSYSFGSQVVATASASASFTLQNTGTTAMTIASVATPATIPRPTTAARPLRNRRAAPSR